MEFIKLNENDNVQICILESSKVFKFGHKYATQKILAGKPIIKYGRKIGIASCEIDEGEHVHVQNLKLLPYKFDSKNESYKAKIDFNQKNLVNIENGKFSGFYNPYNNSVATRKRLIVYEPSAVVYHEHGVNQGGDEERARRICGMLEGLKNS